jgi:hypothetical protein
MPESKKAKKPTICQKSQNFPKKPKKSKKHPRPQGEQKSDLDDSVEGTYVTNYMVTSVGCEKPCT